MTGLCVNYNTPGLLDRMLSGLRKFYSFDMIVVDGSDKVHFPDVEKVVEKYDNVELHHFGYNIHHGPGLDYGIKFIEDEKIMVIDSDIEIFKGDLIELMDEQLKSDSYGIGDVQFVNVKGYNVHGEVKKGSLRVIPYLHPAFMLINRSIALQWPMPIKHGAPMIETMISIHMNDGPQLQECEIVTHDFRERGYIYHDWRGTVDRTGGYHLEKVR
jgi:glycosyltransferase involved in cell wall biosynthesis